MHSSTYKSAADKISKSRGRQDRVYIKLMKIYEIRKIEEDISKNENNNNIDEQEYRSINNSCRKIFDKLIKEHKDILKYYPTWRDLSNIFFDNDWNSTNVLLKPDHTDSLYYVLISVADIKEDEDEDVFDLGRLFRDPITDP